MKSFVSLIQVREEILENMPYKVIHIERCEADDIIGTLVHDTQEFGRHQKVMIISADKDFIQLHKFNNVRQYSPMQKKFVEHPNHVYMPLSMYLKAIVEMVYQMYSVKIMSLLKVSVKHQLLRKRLMLF